MEEKDELLKKIETLETQVIDLSQSKESMKYQINNLQGKLEIHSKENRKDDSSLENEEKENNSEDNIDEDSKANDAKGKIKEEEVQNNNNNNNNVSVEVEVIKIKGIEKYDEEQYGFIAPKLEYKITMFGPPSVGKSSLVLRYKFNRFEQTLHSTIGADYILEKYRIGSDVIKVHIWDTAGQEMNNSLTRTYSRGSSGILLCYDVTRKRSFQLVQMKLKELQRRMDIGIETIVLLVGNKIDLKDRIEVPSSIARKFAKENGILFIETSTKEDINVQSAFLYLIKEILSTPTVNREDVERETIPQYIRNSSNIDPTSGELKVQSYYGENNANNFIFTKNYCTKCI